jgi:hypothetical protein
MQASLLESFPAKNQDRILKVSYFVNSIKNFILLFKYHDMKETFTKPVLLAGAHRENVPVITYPKGLNLPKQFDARKAWPQCTSVRTILGQYPLL